MGLEMLKAAIRSEPDSNWVVVVPDDFSDTRSNFSEFKEFSQGLSLDFHVAGDDSYVESLISDLQPSVGLVCGWYKKIGRQSINLPLGLWGVHNSLLPRYRGGSPLVWAMINGEKIVGSSLFRLNEELDTGVVAAQTRTRIRKSDDIRTVTERLQKQMSITLEKEWGNISSGKRKIFFEQSSISESNWPMRSDADGQIDWSQTAKQVRNFIRAQTTPYQGAYFMHSGDRIRVWECRIRPLIEGTKPGTITLLSNGRYRISCGDGKSIVALRVLREPIEL